MSRVIYVMLTDRFTKWVVETSTLCNGSTIRLWTSMLEVTCQKNKWICTPKKCSP